ncbi:MAG: tetratricopeptide repeat protein [Anaerolineae bacterium]|nr:tetratricopeptide repeat protein [Anaerolineae bacterium]
MYIRRDKSNLHFGRQARRRGGNTIFVIWLAMMLAILVLIWRFENVQSWVLASVGDAPTATPDAVTWARLGERAYLVGDIEKAIEYYGEAARLAPNNIDILFEYGRMLVYRSYAGRNYSFRVEEALGVAEQAIDLAPDHPRAQALMCLALLENGRSEEAISYGLRAEQLAPDYAEASAYLSMAYRGAGRPNQAFQKADEAVVKDPNSLDARRALALGLAFVGEFDAAVQQYERAIQIHPRFDALYFELALYYKAQDNYDAAIAAYDQVLVMEPENVKAYTRKCETYFTMREDSLAQEACEQANQLDAYYPEAWRQLGMVQYTSRNYEGSIESFEQCASLQLSQAAQAALEQIGRADQVSMVQGVNSLDLEAVEDVIAQLGLQPIPLSPDQFGYEIECWYIRGLSHALLARCDEAWPVLQEALQMNPDEKIKGFINQGLMSCVTYEDEYTVDQIPTPIPTEVPAAEPIDIFDAG